MRIYLQSIIFQILFTLYILLRGRQAFPEGKRILRKLFAYVLLIEIAVYFFGYLFYNYLPDGIFIPLMLVCNTWFIASLYITIALLTLEFFRLVNKRWAWYPMFVNIYWDRTKIMLFAVIAVGIVGLMISGYRNVRYPNVQHIYITIPKAAEGRDSLTIVMTSDWHIGEMIGKKQVQDIVRLCNEQNPDITVIVGDLLDYETRFAEKAHIEDDLQQLKAPLGVYMALGNHEYRANRFAKLRWIQKTGITLLVDSVILSPDSTFYLIGRDDYINRRSRASLTTLMQQTDSLRPVILLDHQPNKINETVMNGVDFALHGHTHNGQIWPYSLFLHFAYECPYGYYRKGKSQFFVSSGVGCAGPPYRIGTHSEIVVVHIRFTPEE